MTKQTQVAKLAVKATSNQVGDLQHKAKVTKVLSLGMAATTADKLSNANSDENKAYLSGKKAGAIYLVGAGDTVKMAVAVGESRTSGWVQQGDGTTTTPTGEVIAAGTLGDRKRKHKTLKASAFEAPVVTVADLRDGDHAINISSLSGKAVGSMVVAEDGFIYIAEGSGPQAKWTKQATAQTQITPTAPTVHRLTNIGDKPISRKGVVVAAMPVLVVTEGDLSGKDKDINLSAQSGKAYGALAAVHAAGKTQLVIATGSLPTSKWVRVASGVDITPA